MSEPVTSETFAVGQCALPPQGPVLDVLNRGVVRRICLN